METTHKLNSTLESVAWGALFLWWGITQLFGSLPAGTGAIGIGVILLALNLARRVNGLQISGFTTTLGILAVVLGGLELLTSALGWSFEVPVFAILLIVLGVIFLVPALGRLRDGRPARSG